MDHLIHAIEVGRERKREPAILIHSGKLERVKGRNKMREKQNKGVLSWNGEWGSMHTLGRGSGWATNGLVGDPKGMSTRSQKRLGKPSGQKGVYLWNEAI